MSIRQLFARTVLKLAGWKTRVELPDEERFIIIGAHHTSNWDLPVGLLCLWAHNRKLSWLAKKEIFRGPLYYFFTSLGGIPVDRSAPKGLTEQVAEMFNQQQQLILGITPEGTRSYTEHWKTGFHRIAVQAGVPICFGFADYPSRTVGFVGRLDPSDDITSDFAEIAEFYSHVTGKYPEKQGPVRPRIVTYKSPENQEQY